MTPAPRGRVARASRRRGAGLAIFLAAVAIPLLAGAAAAADPPEWSAPTPPFRTVGNIYYVGTKGLAAYLIVSSRGLVLLDRTLAGNVPQIERNIATLGFRLKDVRLLLNSHAHSDHAGGLAQLKRDTGAELLASPGDRAALESGRPRGDTTYSVMTFPPVKVDRLIADERPVRLGNVTLTPILTPGHTPGCTTWSMDVTERGKPLKVVFLCSITVAGNVLVGNKGYPGIADDFRRTFHRIAGMRADVVLPAHPDLVDVVGRNARRARGDANAFMMPGVLAKLDAEAEQDFEAELGKERAQRR
jgi:metallo-beta-lactamase class B